MGFLDFIKETIRLNREYYDSFENREEPKGIENPYENYPVYIEQTSEESLLTEDGRYDLTRFSPHEDKTIRQVINAANRNYTSVYRAMGLANESYPIIYKPRYVLFDVIVIAYGQSESPLDQMAVSFAYIQKGARYRPDAIRYFEMAIEKVPLYELNRFASVSVLSMLSQIAETYEREHDYKSAIKWYKVLIKKRAGNTDYFKNKVSQLEEKDKNWKPLRRRKPSDSDLEFDEQVYRAALGYANYLEK